jgi:hypothetical protein
MIKSDVMDEIVCPQLDFSNDAEGFVCHNCLIPCRDHAVIRMGRGAFLHSITIDCELLGH